MSEQSGDGPEGSSGARLPEHLRPLFRDGLPEKAAASIHRALNDHDGRLGTGRLGRAMKLSKLALGGGRRFIKGKAKSLAGRGDDEPHPLGTDFAAEMLATFSQMRGMTMKIGQMLSYLDDALPPEARRVLSVLQRDVAPMPWDTVSHQVERELGKPAHEIFEDFETTPMAAASIGQVHRARLPSGERVAVKIQYPGIDEAMAADLKNARFMSMFKQLFFFKTDMAAIMSELEERFMDECDYRKEADYQEAYRARFAGHPHIIVPEVHREFSGQRVLTTSLKEGRTFYEWLASNPEEDVRARVTQLFYRFYIGGFYMDGLFNCDPHPGNYLFQDDGRVVFLDYGCCRQFPEARVRSWSKMVLAVAHDRHEDMRQLAVEVGFFPAGAKYDWEAFRNLLRYLYEPYLEDAPFDFRTHRPQDTFREMFTENPNLFRLNMPSDVVFLNRIGFGLVSLLGQVGSTLNCRQTVERYLEGIDPHWPEDPLRPKAA